MARQRALYFRDLWNLAGAITLARLPLACSVPLFTHSRNGLLAVMTLGVLSDSLDGWVARRTGKVSRMGAVFDGWIDKVLWVNLAWNLALGEWVNPHWMWLWFTRELVMFWVWPFLTLRTLWGEADIHTGSVWGRVATTAVCVAMVAALFQVQVVLAAASVAAGVTGLLAAKDYLTRDRPFAWRRERGP